MMDTGKVQQKPRTCMACRRVVQGSFVLMGNLLEKDAKVQL